ncbi:CNNM domain-containing protein [uncultured Endozoicomonas sp.]|uniref:CNNM domain-containing protein n=1 Tax=uncultured Endozoicomonas sp. TaxID=432652 RepID=UPI00262FE1AB|nr:CNNM domain-containing protein [uncultured Endozoicomonas sp.]
MLLVVVYACCIVLITSFLSLLESSIVAINELRLVTILHRRPERKETLQKVFRKKREHLSSIVLLSTMVSISGSTFLGALAAKEFDDLWLAAFTAILAYVMMVFAKVLPKLIAVQVADRVLVRWCGLIHWIYLLTRPVLQLALVWLHVLPTPTAVVRSGDELQSIIRHYNKKGLIGKRQRKLAEAVLSSHQRKLEELIEKPFTPNVCLPFDASVAAIREVLQSSPCKRYIVLKEDQPAGIVLYRHLARCLVNNEGEVVVGSLVRDAISLSPETSLHEAMKVLQKSRVSMILLSGDSVEKTRIITAKMLYQALLRYG